MVSVIAMCVSLIPYTALVSGSPIQIQTFLVETNTTVLCRQGVCVSGNKEKCPVDFFENNCAKNSDYCGLTTHRGKWMTLFCKKTCHCLEAKGTDEECCEKSRTKESLDISLSEEPAVK